MTEQHAFSGQLCGGSIMHDALDMGVTKLERAAATARDYAPLPEFTDAMLGLIAQAVIGLISGPIDKQADLLANIAKIARRNT